MCLNEDDKCMSEHMLDGAKISKKKDVSEKLFCFPFARCPLFDALFDYQ